MGVWVTMQRYVGVEKHVLVAGPLSRPTACLIVSVMAMVVVVVKDIPVGIGSCLLDGRRRRSHWVVGPALMPRGSFSSIEVMEGASSGMSYV
jgi:hypothetical protein